MSDLCGAAGVRTSAAIADVGSGDGFLRTRSPRILAARVTVSSSQYVRETGPDFDGIMLFVTLLTRAAAVTLTGVAAGLLLAGCAGSPPSVAPSPVVSTQSALNLAGTWTGTGSDGLGPETFTWVIAQSGDALSGSVSMRPLSLTDGSCASCHKVKDGSLSGSVSGTAVTLRMSFALGGSQPTPTCLVIMDVSASGVTSTSLVSSYNGSDSCEPAVALGSMAMTRQ